MTTASSGVERPPPRRPRRRRPARDRQRFVLRWTGIIAAACLVGFGLGYLIIGQTLFPATEGEGVSSVPDLRGMPEGEARDLLRDNDLVMVLGPPLDHPTAAPGTVLTQSPLPGQEASSGAEVRVTVSAGRSRRPVPDLRGMMIGTAADALERTGFRVRVSEVENEAPAGRVLAVQPNPGTMVQLPETVQLTVSSGPATVTVPSLRGMDVDEARAAIEAAGLVVGPIDYNRFSLRTTGTVTAQRPEPEAEVEAGGEVSLTVAGSPDRPRRGIFEDRNDDF